jgi:hypothetical protein
MNWQIVQLDRKTADGFVTTAHWRCDAVDGDFSAGVYGTTGWGEGEPSVPYDSLTQEEVLAWVWESVDKAETEASLADQIEAQKNPQTTSGTPW